MLTRYTVYTIVDECLIVVINSNSKTDQTLWWLFSGLDLATWKIRMFLGPLGIRCRWSLVVVGDSSHVVPQKKPEKPMAVTLHHPLEELKLNHPSDFFHVSLKVGVTCKWYLYLYTYALPGVVWSSSCDEIYNVYMSIVYQCDPMCIHNIFFHRLPDILDLYGMW